MKEKAKFGSKFGLIAATVGSAIGLGNVWRFPATAQANGGAAFLILYIGCVILLGIPVMLAEFSLGRAGRSDSVGNFKNLTPNNKWWIAGSLGLIASYIILSYYMVVAGWTIEYLWESAFGNLYHHTARGFSNTYFNDKIGELICSDFKPLMWTYIMIVINLVILLFGVRKGIEKVSNIMMPMLFFIMIGFCVKSLTLPNASEGLAFFLNPDFSKLDINTVVSALGQAFFSLSLGMGILVTYSAYYPKETKLTRTAVQVSFFDFLMAFIMGLIIFPAVKSFGIGEGDELQGTTLIFVTLPEIFSNMTGTRLWSSLFFLLLSLAAITSTISIAEVSVAFVCDRFRKSRTTACFIVMIPIIATATLSSMSLGNHPSLTIGSLSLFDFLDNFATNILLPISAFFICIYVGWILPGDFIRNELTNYDEFGSWAAPYVSALVRFVCPILIAVILFYKTFCG